jgi:hypothetical protein
MGSDGGMCGEMTDRAYWDRHEQSLRAVKESKIHGNFKQDDWGYQGSIGGI